MRIAKPISLLVLALVLTLACARSVELSVNGRKAEYLDARVQRSEPGWRIQVDLPLGNWKATLENEESIVQILSGERRPLAQWQASLERMRQDRPFRLILADPGNEQSQILMELKPRYPGQGFVEGVYRVFYILGGRASSPDKERKL